MESTLKERLKRQIIDSLNLEEVEPSDIEDSAPLFGDGLGLDSIDALELILLLEREYGIHLATAAEARPIFTSVDSMAEYIERHTKK